MEAIIVALPIENNKQKGLGFNNITDANGIDIAINIPPITNINAKLPQFLLLSNYGNGINNFAFPNNPSSSPENI